MTKTPILDHGYLGFVEHWGSDERIIEAARMSTDKGFQGWGGVDPVTRARTICPECKEAGRLDERDNLFRTSDDAKAAYDCSTCKGAGTKAGDEKLLAYLYQNAHHTPFEMAGMVIEVQAPIVVFREWHRHRTQSYNELSARYTPLPDVNYEPTVDRCLAVHGTNKQAGAVKGSEAITAESAQEWLDELAILHSDAEEVYQSGLRRGIPKEIARLAVNVGRYSRMRASANLRNWLAFLTLRMDEKAQWEIRQYANAVGELIALHYPRTWELFCARRTGQKHP